MTTSTPRLFQLVMDSRDARRLAEFWRQLLGLRYPDSQVPPAAGMDDPRGRDWLNLLDDQGRPLLAIQQVDELPAATWPDPGVPQQLHLDTGVPDLPSLDAAHERVLALGGRLLQDRSTDPAEPLRVYADPDGHPFCVFVA